MIDTYKDLELQSDTPPPPYQRRVRRPLHRNPQPLPLPTRNPCEAKPYCLLKPPIKIFLLFSNLGFGKILAAEKLRQHDGCIYQNSKSCIHPIYTIFNYGNQHINTFSQNYSMYIHMFHYTRFKVYSYKI